VATLQHAAIEVPHSGLLRRDAQPEGRQPLFHFSTKPVGVALISERRHEVVGEARQLSEAFAGLLEASFGRPAGVAARQSLCPRFAVRVTLHSAGLDCCWLARP
jgi:hypothetical protein